MFRPTAFMCAASLLGCMGSGCGVELSTDRAPKVDVSVDLKAQALGMLRVMFPDLSEEELSAITGEVGLSDLLALRDELDAVRKAVAEFSRELLSTSHERVEDRKTALAPHNDGFPAGAAVLGQICTYDSAAGLGEIRLSGAFKGKEPLMLKPEQLSLSIDGAQQAFALDCIAGGPSVDIVFLIDITGSMSNVIASVRNSVANFVDLIEASGVRGTLSVVTFQDSVGVNRTFQEPAPAQGYERSPFYAPVSLSDPAEIEGLRKFVNRLEANRGDDAPENLAGAIDFARNSVIGYDSRGAANVIGDGREDPVGTAAFPGLKSDRQIFVVLTDITFHGDDRNATNSSLLAPFVPRDAKDILATLRKTGTTVHVSDPSWVDTSTDPASPKVDADYWALQTGGLGEDVSSGYSLLDLEVVVVAEQSGLSDIALDRIIRTSCTLSFAASLSATASVELTLAVEGEVSTSHLAVQRY
jgi:hypothetical protein